ncbi:MAG: substrate-binding domain-containing protein [Actinobacteria bacterium]|nr:substrate-binding domain-containing protein [Actinomycetota bacterium]
MKKVGLLLLIAVFVVSMLGFGVGCKTTAAEATTAAVETTATETTAATTAAETTAAVGKKINLEDYATRGPNGEVAVSYTELKLTEQEKEEIRKGNYNAALLMLTNFEFFTALTAGAQSVFDDLNIKVVANMDAQMDVVKQKDNVETVMALNPKIIVALALDPVTAAEAFKPAVDAGVKISFLSNLPNGYKFGKDYFGLVTEIPQEEGEACAELLANSMGKKGKIGWVFHDTNFYVTNQRDNAFKAVIEANYPEMEIVAEGGVADFAKSNEVVAGMLTTHPEITGLYVTTDPAMGGVLAALREAKRQDVKVVTIDLGLESAIDMAQGKNVVGIAADYPFQLGEALALTAAYGIIGKEAPDFVTVGVIKVTKDNLLEGWKQSLNSEPPQALKDVYNK